MIAHAKAHGSELLQLGDSDINVDLNTQFPGATSSLFKDICFERWGVALDGFGPICLYDGSVEHSCFQVVFFLELLVGVTPVYVWSFQS